jgi:hypothetical protein
MTVFSKDKPWLQQEIKFLNENRRQTPKEKFLRDKRKVFREPSFPAGVSSDARNVGTKPSYLPASATAGSAESCGTSGITARFSPGF